MTPHIEYWQVYRKRDLSIEEARFLVDHELRTRYSATINDVNITAIRGTWRFKSPCKRPGCTPYCGGETRHTMSFFQAKASYLAESGEYEGGGYDRDDKGRMLSPYRAWDILFAHAQASGACIDFLRNEHQHSNSPNSQQ